MPWYAKALAGCVAAYALSPIDLIPDFIPVLGYLDDLIIVPLGILLVVAADPARHHGRASRHGGGARGSSRTAWAAPIAIIAIWTALCVLFAWLAYRSLSAES